MLQINLLPWREQARKAKLLRLGVMTAFAVGLGMIFVVFFHLYFNRQINIQEERNIFLRTALKEVDSNLTLLKVKQKDQLTLTDQLKFLVGLRQKSYQAVYLLQVLAASSPAALMLDKITREDGIVTLAGKAQSDLQITQFIKTIGETKGLDNPILTQISSEKVDGGSMRSFQLKVEQKESQ